MRWEPVEFQTAETWDHDGGGGRVHKWVPLFRASGRFRPQSSREALEAGRLQSSTLGILTIRESPAAARVTNKHRVVFRGRACKIHAGVQIMDGRWREFTIEEGVAT